MRALLDVNFLIALTDMDHVFHESSFAWFSENIVDGWASCPLTENAFVRITSHPRYSGFDTFTVNDSIFQLKELICGSDHQFWCDEISLLDGSYFDSSRILGPRQITDIYLLALATHNRGRLVTFDERIPISTVPSAVPENLVVISNHGV